MNELKPCPFCGGEAKLHKKGNKFYVECDGDCWTQTSKYSYQEDAIKAWNDLERRKEENAPTVDAVEVVRCKDCKYYFQDEIYGEICRHPELDFEIECYDHWINTKPEDFCSYGERKEGAGNG